MIVNVLFMISETASFGSFSHCHLILVNVKYMNYLAVACSGYVRINIDMSSFSINGYEMKQV